MADVNYRCTCGTVRGTLRAPEAGMRLVCMCSDCQAFLEHLGRPDLLDQWRGTDIFQTTPDRLTITQGQEHMRCLRLAQKGMIRWYADCCNTPLGNTMASPGVPFVGIPTAALEDLTHLPPIRHRIQAHSVPHAPPEAGHPGVPPAVILRSMLFLARSALRRRHQPSPFRSADGTLRVEPRVLTPTERAALG